MLKLDKLVFSAVLLSAIGAMAEVDYSGIGRDATEAEVAAWDTDVRPDGLGAPVGSGSADDGEMAFAEKCASCHGDFAEGLDRWPVLSGGVGTLTSADPVKTPGSYWPYISTLIDYIPRAMPFGDAHSLTPDEVYGIAAYILNMSDVIDSDFVLSNENMLEVEMPNAGQFYFDDRDTTEYPQFSAEACMSDCRDPNFEITARARDVDVTPEDEAAAAAEAAAEEAAATEAPAEDAVVEEAAVEESAADPELVAAGEKVFKKCKACHAADEEKNGTGPHLVGIFDRPVGTVDGFKYSKDMEAFGAEGNQWNDENLRAFLAKPKDLISGTKMSFAGLKPKDLDAIIAFLQTK